MYLQLFSSSADCSSVLQLYPTGLLRLYLVLNSSKSETNYIFLRFSWQGHGDPVSCAYLQHAPYKFRHVAHVRGRKNPFHFYLKVHLTPIFFSLNRIYLLFEAFGRKNFWIYLNPRFSMPSQSRAWSVARPSLGRQLLMTSTQDWTKHNGASVSSLYLLEKMASKINRSSILGLKRPTFV